MNIKITVDDTMLRLFLREWSYKQSIGNWNNEVMVIEKRVKNNLVEVMRNSWV